MNHYNSTIKRKLCKRDSCHKFPAMGKLGYCSFGCMPEDLRERETAKSVQKRKNQYNANLSRKLHQVGNDTKKEKELKFEPRSSFKNDSTIPDKGELLALADKLFSQYIKKRDADSLGNVTCPCCGRTFNLKDKDESGEKVVQTLHFVKRGVYSLRFSERNCVAGCSDCNRNQHFNPSGTQYQRLKEFLIKEYGEHEVEWMENQHREINKLSAGDLQMVINQYSVKKGKT